MHLNTEEKMCRYLHFILALKKLFVTQKSSISIQQQILIGFNATVSILVYSKRQQK